MPNKGTCFQLLLNPETEKNHFWIVISEIVDGRVLVANITDSLKCPDSPCHFTVDEHSTITKPSAVHYKRCRAYIAANIDIELSRGVSIRQLPDYPKPLVDRIIAGAKLADPITFKFQKYLP
ncbi:MAG TPA: hypothetical protein VGI03_09510 [Verrucomicrobiae bacterium]|jgi:hypothetical protein